MVYSISAMSLLGVISSKISTKAAVSKPMYLIIKFKAQKFP